MRNYEIMYILKADLDEAAREAAMQDLQKLLEDNGAQVKSTDAKLGLRELAYPINDETKGFYVVLKVSANDQALNEFNRLVKINANVLRHLVTVDQE